MFAHDFYEKNTTDPDVGIGPRIVDKSGYAPDLVCGDGSKATPVAGFNGCGNFYTSDSSFRSLWKGNVDTFWTWKFTSRSGEAGSRSDAGTRYRKIPGNTRPAPATIPMQNSPAVPYGVVPPPGVFRLNPTYPGVPRAVIPYLLPGMGRLVSNGPKRKDRLTIPGGDSPFIKLPQKRRPGRKPAIPITPHTPAPPGQGVKEGKTRMSAAALKALAAANLVLEGKDVIDAVYKALPASVRSNVPKNGRTRKGSMAGEGTPYVLPQDKLAAIYANMDKLDVPKAIANVIMAQAIDKAGGTLHAGADRRSNKSLGGARILGFT